MCGFAPRPDIRQGTYSIVLMAVVDSKYEFVLIDVGAEGRQSDGSIFKASEIGQGLDQGILNLPKLGVLPGCQKPRLAPYAFVGDKAFQLRTDFLRPYPAKGLADERGAYNYRLSRAWLYREHRDAFELPEEIFRKQYRLPKIVVRWLCDELREEPEVRRVRSSWTVMTVELQVLCALRFYGTGSFQGMVASDEHVARDQKTVSVAVRAVSVAIVRRLGVQRGWIHFPETPSERFDAEKGFRLLGRIPGVIGCVDGTMVSIVGPSKNDPTVTKAAYWCRKYFYALNVMVVTAATPWSLGSSPLSPGTT
ncbi:putative nuclease HARBI1 isoform X2 [Ixodes scapularis]